MSRLSVLERAKHAMRKSARATSPHAQTVLLAAIKHNSAKTQQITSPCRDANDVLQDANDVLQAR